VHVGPEGEEGDARLDEPRSLSASSAVSSSLARCVFLRVRALERLAACAAVGVAGALRMVGAGRAGEMEGGAAALCRSPPAPRPPRLARPRRLSLPHCPLPGSGRASPTCSPASWLAVSSPRPHPQQREPCAPPVRKLLQPTTSAAPGHTQLSHDCASPRHSLAPPAEPRASSHLPSATPGRSPAPRLAGTSAR